MNRIHRISLSILLLFFPLAMYARDYSVTSPSGTLKMTVSTGAKTTWALSVAGKTISENNKIEMTLDDGRILGYQAAVSSAKTGQINETIPSPFYRQAQIKAYCNTLTLKMRSGWSLELRAYDEGVAYRFVTSMKDSLTIKNETVQYHHSGDLVIPLISPNKDRWETTFETEYTFYKDSVEIPAGKLGFLPILSTPKENVGRILLMESDVEDYPGMFIQQSYHLLSAEFSPVPSSYKYVRAWAQRPTEYKDYIARTAGSRTFPWRIIAWAKNDTDLPVNNLVYALGAKNRIKDTSWIKAGLSTWDWWSARRLYGVDFEAGINTATYKYHIDFASSYGVPYILIDEGWYKWPDIMHPIPKVNLPELCRYAKEKGVSVILWSTSGLILSDMENIFSHYEAMGVGGFKLDFMDSQNQTIVHNLYRIAESAARHHLVIDFHGMYKPTGMSRTFPNVLNCEGVYGLEQIGHKGIDMPLNDVTIPYIRMAAGHMDYTPGGMFCAAKDERANISRGAYVQGTRSHQIATFVVFDQPLGMMADSPSRYMAEPQTTSFITSIPTVFDRTFIQSGKVGRNIVTVRNAGERWFVGGLTAWEESDVIVDFSFLPAGKWKLKYYHDGVNSHKIGNDYRLDELIVDSTVKLPVHMAPGGGFAMILTKQP